MRHETPSAIFCTNTRDLSQVRVELCTEWLYEATRPYWGKARHRKQGTQEALNRDLTHTHSASSIMVIYTYGSHTNFITHRLSHTHAHSLSNRPPCLGDPDFIDDISHLFLRKKKAHRASSSTPLVGFSAALRPRLSSKKAQDCQFKLK